MHLEHLHLVVSDLLKSTLAFYQAAFPHWHITGKARIGL